MSKTTSLLLIAGSFAVAGSAEAQTATFTVMGDGIAWDMSPDGKSVAGQDAQGAFLWTEAGGYVPLGETDARAVSGDGTVVLGNITDINGRDAAGVWTLATGWVDCGDLGSASGSMKATGYDLSGDGTIAVGLGWTSPGSAQGFRWTQATGMVGIPYLGPNSSRADAISEDGQVIGGFDEHQTGPRRAAIWDANFNETFVLVSATNPDGLGEVNGLSSDGTYAVGTEMKAGYIWSAANGVTNFGQLPNAGGFDTGWAHGVSDDGQVVVGGFRYFPFPVIGTIWTPSGGLEELRDYLINHGATGLANFEIANGSAISPDGKTIVGYGTDTQSNQQKWFIATLDGTLGTSYCGPANANSTGNAGTITANGSATVGDNDVLLMAENLPTSEFGYFLNSMTQGFVQNPGNSQGNLCLGGQIGRYNASVGNTGNTGTLSLQLDLAATPTPSGNVSVMAGETWNFTCWFRDMNPSPTSNFTDAVSIGFN